MKMVRILLFKLWSLTHVGACMMGGISSETESLLVFVEHLL